jgi:hypothetical protein
MFESLAKLARFFGLGTRAQGEGGETTISGYRPGRRVLQLPPGSSLEEWSPEIHTKQGIQPGYARTEDGTLYAIQGGGREVPINLGECTLYVLRLK